MARLPRFIQKIFAGNYSGAPSGQIAQFGSLAAGTPSYTADLTVLQALSQFSNGWLAGAVGNHSPTAQDMNALFYLVTAQLAYLMQRGVPEYDATTEYHTGCFVSSSGVLYRCLQDNQTGAPLTNANVWEPYAKTLGASMSGAAKAWVNFTVSGSSVTVVSSHNVSGVSRSAQGVYDITIGAGVLADSGYAFSASSTQNDTGGTAQIITRFPGDTKTATSLRVRSVNATDSNLYDATEVSIVFFR